MMKFKPALLADILAVACGSGMAQTAQAEQVHSLALLSDVPYGGADGLYELVDWMDKTVRQPRG